MTKIADIKAAMRNKGVHRVTLEQPDQGFKMVYVQQETLCIDREAEITKQTTSATQENLMTKPLREAMPVGISDAEQQTLLKDKAFTDSIKSACEAHVTKINSNIDEFNKVGASLGGCMHFTEFTKLVALVADDICKVPDAL